jgi:hypothetical protein
MRKSFLRRLLFDTSGGAAVVVALSAPIFVGGLGLGTEVGLWYFNQRKLQNAADVAAFAAAVERRANRAERMNAAALAAAAASGLSADRGAVTVVSPPETGAFAGDLRAVEVRVEERVPRVFTALFSTEPVPLAGRAVAQISEGLPTCVLALHPSASHAIQIGGNSETFLSGCNVHANSLADDATYIHGNATIETDCLSSAGGVGIASNATLRLTSCAAVYINAGIVPDPFSHLKPPPLPSLKKAEGSVLEPGHYTGNVHLTGAVHLQPGVYVIDGDFRVNAQAKVTGTDVTLFLRGNNVMQINAGADVKLSAPRQGPYADVLIYGDPQAGGNNQHTINGGAGIALDGVVYIPRGEVLINGNSAVGGACMPVVARTVRVTGTTRIDVDCLGRTIDSIQSSRLVRLVE